MLCLLVAVISAVLAVANPLLTNKRIEIFYESISGYNVEQAALLSSPAAAGPVVINEKTKISYQGTSEDGVEQFRNIRFAEDTSGPNRFAPPKPFLPPPGSKVKATERGAACPQASGGAVPPMTDVLKQSEDCLNLRIARPADSKLYEKPLPVMVYIYGGK